MAGGLLISLIHIIDIIFLFFFFFKPDIFDITKRRIEILNLQIIKFREIFHRIRERTAARWNVDATCRKKMAGGEKNGIHLRC